MAATSTKTAFAVICPFCLNSDETVHLDLNDLTSLTCSGCSESFTAQAARDKAAECLAQWERVVRWLELAEKV